MDPTNGRVALVVSGDYGERFPLRSALDHFATNVPPEVLPLKAGFLLAQPMQKQKANPASIGILCTNHHSPRHLAVVECHTHLVLHRRVRALKRQLLPLPNYPVC